MGLVSDWFGVWLLLRVCFAMKDVNRGGHDRELHSGVCGDLALNAMKLWRIVVYDSDLGLFGHKGEVKSICEV